jgi:hypothetical protein
MQRSVPILIAAGAMLFGSPVSAQESQQVVFGTYYRCDQGSESRADEIVRETFAPVFDRHMSAGHFSAWGWLAHEMGTEWRRLLFWIGTDRDVMFDARDQLVQSMQEENAAAARELGTICPTHDDYIWNVVATSEGWAQIPGDASHSAYHMCDLTQQARADTLFTRYYAPIYDRAVAEGTPASWGWLAHRVGGKWRRLLNMSAPDAKSLLNAQETVLQRLNAEHPFAWQELQSICWTHDDYIWNTVISRP